MARKQAKRRKQKKTRKMPRVVLPIGKILKMTVALAVVGLSYEISARLLDQPIRAITIDGPFQRVSALQIEEAIGPHLADGFLSANLRVIRDRLMELPWIDQARVARRWPATLEIQVTEQVPAATWGETGLLNTRGELFVTEARHLPAELPRMSGPEGRSAEVAKTYLSLRDRLIPMGLDLRRVHMDERGAWEVTLANGVDVRLGRRDVDDRIGLFLDVVANLVSSREADIEFVDMRYGNGFSIGWTEAADDEATSPGDANKELVAGTYGSQEVSP